MPAPSSYRFVPVFTCSGHEVGVCWLPPEAFTFPQYTARWMDEQRLEGFGSKAPSFLQVHTEVFEFAWWRTPDGKLMRVIRLHLNQCPNSLPGFQTIAEYRRSGRMG